MLCTWLVCREGLECLRGIREHDKGLFCFYWITCRCGNGENSRLNFMLLAIRCCDIAQVCRASETAEEKMSSQRLSHYVRLK